MKKLEPSVKYGFAYLIGESAPDAIIGKIMEIIEAIGLPSTQEGAVKNLIKQVLYDKLQGRSIYISGSLNGAIIEALERQNKEFPPRAVKLEDIK